MVRPNLLCAGLALALAWVMLTFPARAAGAPDARTPGAQTGAGARSSAGRPSAVRAPRRNLATPQRAMHPSASRRADLARGPVSRQTSHAMRSNRAASGSSLLSRPGSLGAATRNALPAPKLTMAPRNSAIGGPHVQSAGRLEGGMVGRTNRGAAVGGTQFRRKS